MPRALLAVLLATAATALWVANCSGPEPKVTEVRLQAPAQEGEPYRVEAVVRNEGRGHGQVAVVFRLLDRATGQTVEEDKQATLDPGERTLVTAELRAPPADYEPRVEVEYPPR